MKAPPVFSAHNRLTLPMPPDQAACAALWDKYNLPEHIRQHSRMVAMVAEETAALALNAGLAVDLKATRAAGLLHDLAKMHTLTYGGKHGPLAGAWIMAATRHVLVAQAVFHHVYWPWKLDLDKNPLPLIIIYADKRVSHDRLVSLSERYEDIMTRYGLTEAARQNINKCNKQWREIEKLLTERLGTDLNAHTFNRRRMVE